MIYTFAIIEKEKDKQGDILSLTSKVLSWSAIFKKIEFTKNKRFFE